MNQLTQVKASVPVSVGTAHLIRASGSDNTLKAYRHALKKLESCWLVENLTIDCWRNILRSCILLGDRRRLSLKRLPAVKWRGLEDAVGEITLRTLAGIRREGRERGRGQVDGANTGGHGAGVFVR